MVNTGEGQEDSRSLVRKQSVLFYTLRRFNKSQRRGGPGRSTGRDGGTSHYRQDIILPRIAFLCVCFFVCERKI